MSASQEQKVDFLLKKIGYTASKTGIAEDETGISGTKKAPFAEPIPSPLTLPGANVWSQSNQIPATPPGSTTSIVRVYKTGTAQQLTFDSTVADNRSFVSRETAGEVTSTVVGDWVDTQFGSDYIVKVYKGDPNAGGVQLSAAGSGSNDTWFFDYSAGVLNFNGTNVPSGITTTNIYIEGYRYTGIKGITGVAQTFTDLEVSGITTFNGTVDMNSTLDVDGDTQLDDLTVAGVATFSSNIDANGTLDVDGDTQLDDLNVSGVATFSNTVDLNAGLDIDGQLDVDELVVAGVSTFNNSVDINSTLDVDGDTQLDDLTVAGVATFSSNIDANAGLDVDGQSDLDEVVVAGVSTFNNAVDINSTLDVDGDTQLDDLNVTGIATFNNNVKLLDDDKLLLGTGEDLQIYMDGSASFIDDVGSGDLSIRGSSVILGKPGSTEAMLKAVPDAEVNLYFDGVNRLKTANGGVIITGVTTSSGGFSGNLTGNADTAGKADGLTTARTIGGVSFDGSANINLPGVNTSGNQNTSGTAAGLSGSPNITITDVSGVGGNFTGIITANKFVGGGINTEGTSSFTDLEVSKGLTVGGVSTFTGNATFNGSINAINNLFQANGDVDLGSDSADTISANGRFDTSLIPSADVTQDLGQATGTTRRWGTLHTNFVNAVGVGTFGSLDISGDIDVDGHTELDDVNVSGAITATTFTGNLAGTVNTAAQPNITSLGTLSAVTVSGNINANGNIVGDSATNITGIAGVTASTLTGTLQTAAQPNITSVGTLSSLNVTGNVSVGGTLTYEDVTNIDSVGLVTARNGVRITAGGLDVTGVSTFSGNITGTGDLTLTSTDTGSSAAPIINLFRNSASPDDADYLGQIKFQGESDTGVQRNYAKITGKILDASNGTEDGIIEFAHIKAGSQNISARFRSDSLQLLNGTALTVAGDITANGNIAGDGSTNITGINEITAAGNITANGNIIGDNSTNISGINSVTATSFFGNGANLSGVGTQGPRVEAESLTVSGISTFIGNISVTGISTFNGNVEIGDVIGSQRLQIGNSNAQIYRQNNHFYIDVAGEKDLNLTSNSAGGNGGDIHLRTVEGGRIDLTGTGGVGIYHTDTAKKLETTSTGVVVTGILTATSFSGSSSGLTGIANANIASDAAIAGTKISPDFGSQNIVTTGDFNSGSVTITGGTPAITFTDSNNDPDYYIQNNNGALRIFDSTNSAERFVVNANGSITLGTGSTIGALTGVTTYYGDGSNLSGVGFSPDSQENLYAGTSTGAGSDADTCFNVALGFKAACTLNEGDHNVALGTYALKCTTSGIHNVMIGSYSGRCNQTGSCNIAIGRGAMQGGDSLTSGTERIGIGRNALRYATGSCSIGIGPKALAGASSGTVDGTNNIGIGKYAGELHTTGSNNIFLGQKAGQKLSTGGDNIVMGQNAMACCTVTGSNNIVMGCAAGLKFSSANNNVVLGAYAMRNGVNASATNSVVIGTNAGRSITSAQSNILIGNSAGYTLTSAHGNTFVGHQSGCLTTGASNVSIGKYSSCSQTAGDRNIVIGEKANLPVLDGSDQILFQATNTFFYGCCSGGCTLTGIGTDYPDNAVGSGVTSKLSVGIVSAYQLYGDGSKLSGISAGFEPDADENLVAGTDAGGNLDGSSGCFNVLLGNDVGKALTSGANNTILGCGAGEVMTSGSINVIIGKDAMGHCDTTGSNNVAIGCMAGRKVTSGNSNIFLGQYAGGNVTTGCNNLIFGQSTGGTGTLTGSHNILMAHCAGKSTTSGACNIILGRLAGENVSAASNNIWIGGEAGRCQTCQNNIFIGQAAGKGGSSTPANNATICSVGIGQYALCQATNGQNNTAIGAAAGRCNGGGNQNVFVGHHAGQGSCSEFSGFRNTFVGKSAGKDITSARGNAFLGFYAGENITTGCYNSTLGHKAGCNITTGNSNIAIGCDVFVPSETGSNQLAIGSGTNRWIAGNSDFNVGIGSTTNPTSRLTVTGDVNISGVATATDFDSTSDIRLKTNIKPIDDPVSKVIQIEGVSFNWKKDDRPALGVIADQVEKILPQLVHGDDPKTVNYNGLVGLLIEVVKDQQKQIDSLNDRISKLE